MKHGKTARQINDGGHGAAGSLRSWQVVLPRKTPHASNANENTDITEVQIMTGAI